MKNKAYKYRIYPNAEQRELFAKTFGCCRFIWNVMLSDKMKYYDEHKQKLHNTPAQYKAEFPFLKEVDSLALANVQLNLQTAYNNFFGNRKTGFPKFKSKKRTRASYTTNNQKGSVAVLEKAIKLPKVGIVKAKIHRNAPDDYVLKSATVSMEHDGTYYVSVLYEYEEIVAITKGDKAIGLDYKSDGLYCDSDGNVADMPHFYRKQQKKLAKEQRKLAKKLGSRKGEPKSANFMKQLRKVNKIHRKAANQRKDYLHKLSAEIVNQYDIVCVESLDMKAMSNKGFGNGKATLDNGYGMFLDMLKYKLADKGKRLIKVDRWFPSSQICSDCGALHKLGLNERTYICECGNTIDRDHNAAINIKTEGLRLLSA